MNGPFGGLSARTEPNSEPRGLGLVLPGRAYSPSAPLLEFARLALLQNRYAVQQVWWDSGSRPADLDPNVWVAEQAAAALTAETVPPRRVVVVGKSLGARATPYAAEHGFDAIWLTPLLVEATVVAGIRENPARQLVVGGLADEFWDSEVAADLVREGCQVMEIPDADHGLCVAGDAVRSAAIHADVTRAMDAFLSGLESA
jgi:hypothetical protein